MRWRWRRACWRWRAGVDRLARPHIWRFDRALLLAREMFLRVLGREDGNLALCRNGYGCCCAEQLEPEYGVDLVETFVEPWAPLDLTACPFVRGFECFSDGIVSLVGRRVGVATAPVLRARLGHIWGPAPQRSCGLATVGVWSLYRLELLP